MIQEISPRKFHCEYIPGKKPELSSYMLVFTDQGILMEIAPATEEHLLPIFDDFFSGDKAGFSAVREKARYLFAIDQELFFLADASLLPDHFEKKGVRFEPLSFLRTWQPQYLAFAAITASQICRFYQTRRYCGKCGHAAVHSDTERAMVCPVCGQIDYPKISPAIIVAIRDGDRIVLTQNIRSAYPHRALVAGFVEIGETPEEAVHREVLEETGLRVKNVTLYKMQPWAFSDTLMIGFTADLDGSDKIRIQKSELTDARWFDRKDVQAAPFHISVGHEMIDAFMHGEI